MRGKLHDVGAFTWRVVPRTQTQFSPVFYSGPHAWRLKMYPRRPPHLSVYLCVADASQLPQDWSCQAHFTLALTNHLDPARTVSKDLKSTHDSDADAKAVKAYD
ncbi:hypothetical protein T492DRAFT_870136 [Pavlovales sp. CCMP2436]|nr:hypothetical protein T492DRAFT_870136 [Pavlovales sp. CCMP2436]